MQHRYNTLQAWLDWQEGLHKVEIDLGLSRINAVSQRLGLGRTAANIITVGGTNGKGSTVAVLESIYHQAGYRIGTFTSPHLLTYNERIKIQGKPVSDEALCAAFSAIDHARDDISLTYFEFSALAAFYIFAKLELDIAILEVGLGGRLDATNIIDADVSIITSIGLDHQQWLGHTRQEIAREKAGIFRSGRPAICADPLSYELLSQSAENEGVSLFVATRDYHYKVSAQEWSFCTAHRQYGKLPRLSFESRHQVQNAAAALMATELLSDRLPLEPVQIQRGLRSFYIPGRFEILKEKPMVIVDVAHNVDAIVKLCEQLEQLRFSRFSIVFGLLNDKALNDIVKLLEPYIDHWYIAALDSDRSFTVSELKMGILAQNAGANISQYSDIMSAYQSALSNVGDKGAVLVTGSFLSVSKILALA